MKKFSLLLIVLCLVPLIGCGKETEVEEELEEQEIDLETLKDLAYYEYLNYDNPVITIKVKNLGEMKAQLFPNVAPNTVNNYITYILDESFKNSQFHRVIKDFMIQGGIVKQTRKAIPGEFRKNNFDNPLNHTRGVLSMARTATSYNSQTSQFFIMHVNYPFLDGDYASFGGLISGFDVLDAIANMKTNFNDQPLEAVMIESITVNLKNYEVKEVIYA
ncbi:peptidylprolyl isomerase [Acholeplasma hippikon]|uniref:Peptidyl-prolyl cis-trans isomerase n=1 Tax=Acholeplasma hippikon TaxID=264636 RepID=A0A449BI41_9MOLU|nr:peptidylprolyl isomerase [Acholeplasma hippikon]VEU82083.1 Peptidyl-prolyl cis-trans isomerase B [Acholeplasma hippikon]